MKHFVFKAFIAFCIVLGLTGCIFSYKPNIEGSSVSVTDKTTNEGHYNEKKQ